MEIECYKKNILGGNENKKKISICKYTTYKSAQNVFRDQQSTHMSKVNPMIQHCLVFSSFADWTTKNRTKKDAQKKRKKKTLAAMQEPKVVHSMPVLFVFMLFLVLPSVMPAFVNSYSKSFYILYISATYVSK